MKREFYIAGVKFYQANTIINDLKVDDKLEMLPDPTNKFDASAVELSYNGIMLGFVPAKFSTEVSAALEVHDNVTCTLTEVNLSAEPWEQLKVCIETETPVSER